MGPNGCSSPPRAGTIATRSTSRARISCRGSNSSRRNSRRSASRPRVSTCATNGTCAGPRACAGCSCEHPVDILHAHSPYPAGIARLVHAHVAPPRRGRVRSTRCTTPGGASPGRAACSTDGPWRWTRPTSRSPSRRTPPCPLGSAPGPRSWSTGSTSTPCRALADRDGARRELGIGPDEVVFGTVANFRAQKDYPNLLAAAARAGRPRRRRADPGGRSGPARCRDPGRARPPRTRGHRHDSRRAPRRDPGHERVRRLRVGLQQRRPAGGADGGVGHRPARGGDRRGWRVRGDHRRASTVCSSRPGIRSRWPTRSRPWSTTRIGAAALAAGAAGARTGSTSAVRWRGSRRSTGRWPTRNRRMADTVTRSNRTARPPRSSSGAPTAADRDAILDLLRVSLGREVDDRYEALFAWKHVENAFGPSPAWIACDGDRIAGFRTLMRWEFLDGDQVVRAVRAVDTATHPDYQGRGIFTRLTLACARRTRGRRRRVRVQHAQRPEPPGLPQDGVAGRGSVADGRAADADHPDRPHREGARARGTVVDPEYRGHRRRRRARRHRRGRVAPRAPGPGGRAHHPAEPRVLALAIRHATPRLPGHPRAVGSARRVGDLSHPGARLGAGGGAGVTVDPGR